ncbi:MAG: tetratricopeptide repeat protein [Rhodospirillales bacterium]|nr:tetratricopeptide repeat protein [Rhodospirillales bacterium]
MSESAPPEWANPIVSLGNQVVFGVLLAADAGARITQDAGLRGAADARLEALIDEADKYWWAHLDAAGEQPRNVAIYPELATALAEERLRMIGAFRKGASAAERPDFDARMAHWIAVTARALLSVGMTRLLLREAAAARMAYDAFEKANWVARALPDDGRLRLREVLCAAFGLRVAAQVGGQQQIAAAVGQELAALMRAPGREKEAAEHLAEIERKFDALRTVILSRKPVSADKVAETGGQGGPSDLALPARAPPVWAPPISPPPLDRGPDAYAVFYQELLNWFGGLVLAGRLSQAEAGARLVEHVDLSRLAPRYIYFVSESHRNLAGTAPDRARILGELNHAVAMRLAGPQADLTRGYCAYAVARAYVAEARRMSPAQPQRYRAAVPWLEEALRLLGADDPGEVAIVHCAAIVSLLGLCHRGAGEFDKARDFAREAIRRHEALPPGPFHRANLGAAYGNLGDAEERLGNTAAARQSYYRAFELFAEARDLERLRQSLADYARLCGSLGRLDDALAAQERAAALMAELADVPGAVACFLALAQSAFATRQFERGLAALARADALLARPPMGPADRLREHLDLRFQVRSLEGYVRSLVAIGSETAADAERALTTLHEAQALAVELGDADALSTIVLQIAMLLSQLKRLDEAEACCATLDTARLGPAHMERRREVLADIRKGQGRPVEAVALLRDSVAAYRDSQRTDRLAVVLHRLGEAYEAVGDAVHAVTAYEGAIEAFERHRLGLYEASRLEVTGHVAETYARAIALRSDPVGPVFDPTRALDLLERSKSRVFAEMLGLSPVQPHRVPPAARAALEEEAGPLARVSQLRATLFLAAESSPERLRLQQELSTQFEQLEELWRRLAGALPEYGEIRRGTTLVWADFQDILAA